MLRGYIHVSYFPLIKSLFSLIFEGQRYELKTIKWLFRFDNLIQLLLTTEAGVARGILLRGLEEGSPHFEDTEDTEF